MVYILFYLLAHTRSSDHEISQVFFQGFFKHKEFKFKLRQQKHMRKPHKDYLQALSQFLWTKLWKNWVKKVAAAAAKSL